MISPGLLPLTMNTLVDAVGAPDGNAAIEWNAAGAYVGACAAAPPMNVQWACAAPAMNVQNCIIEFPATWAPAPQPVQHTHYHFTPSPPVAPRLADEDVERIAKRVAELLREKP